MSDPVDFIRRAASLAVCMFVPGLGSAQVDRPNLAGMWSDPPLSADALLCFNACMSEGLERLHEVLNDSANDGRSVRELLDEATEYQSQLVESEYLTPAALADGPPDLADDPGLIACEPWGFARQILAPHQLEIQQFEDRLEMRYSEWDVLRIVYLEGHQSEEPLENTPMGYSVARYEGEELVIETKGIEANLFWAVGLFTHSDQLTAVERYTRTGATSLRATILFEDPMTLRKPLRVIKNWRWAPEEEIFEYECNLNA